jgi:hypothetical protein
MNIERQIREDRILAFFRAWEDYQGWRGLFQPKSLLIMVIQIQSITNTSLSTLHPWVEFSSR